MHIFHRRQGQMVENEMYFYTATIQNFIHLFNDDGCKMIVVNSLKWLVDNNRIILYGFVIMPHHIHLIWTVHEANVKETAAGSFAKYTAHAFKKYLLQNAPHMLSLFKTSKSDRDYQFWKRDQLAIPLSSEINLIQKLDYIHNNPLKEKWSLSTLPESYKWSSARFYEDGTDEFNMLTHYKD